MTTVYTDESFPKTHKNNMTLASEKTKIAKNISKPDASINSLSFDGYHGDLLFSLWFGTSSYIFYYRHLIVRCLYRPLLTKLV